MDPPIPTGTVPMDVPGFDPALVSFPSTPQKSRPVVFVAHGAGGQPESSCPTWREVVGERAVLVCLTGPRTDVHGTARYFPDHHVLAAILDATRTRFQARYGSVVDTSRAVYAGFSQGVTMGSLVVPELGAAFPRLALVEGGFDQWSGRSAASFRANGGERVLVACGTKRCAEGGAGTVRLLRAAGLEARLLSNLAEGHAFGPRMLALVKDGFDWLVEGDPRFTRASE